MKKDFLLSIVVAILLVFGVKTYYEKKADSNTQVAAEKEVSNGNENEMLVPGYALGEIPPITAPEMPDLSVTENPDAKITLDMTKKISSVPGISVTPVKVENSNIVGGDYSMQIGQNGDGQFTDKDKSVQTDGKGKAKITFNGKTTEVDAKPLEKPETFSKFKMVPPVPSIEANSLLITLDSGILFDVDKYDLRPEAEEVLKNLAIVLKEADIKAFEVDGHTDSDASDKHNQILSENRANAVKNFLTSQGITAEITIKGYGESRPIASNDTAEGKQKNRRVEIIIPTI